MLGSGCSKNRRLSSATPSSTATSTTTSSVATSSVVTPRLAVKHPVQDKSQIKESRCEESQREELDVPAVPSTWNEATRSRWKQAQQYGDFTIVYSTVCQPGLQYFETADGYQAYGKQWGYTFALGDPVAPAETHAQLLQKFCQTHRRPCFVNVSDSTAAHLHELGFYVNQMGVDTSLPLATYDFSGKAKEPFRYAANWLKRRNYRVEEGTFREVSVQSVAELSGNWRTTRTVKDREVGFLNRPLVLEDEPDVRKFFLIDSEERLQAFVFFDPLYRDGKVVGYSTVIKRRLPDATNYAEQGIMKTAIEQFKSEGIGTVRLGLSPLAGIHRHRFRRNPLLHWGWRYGFQAGWVNRYFYNLRGHAEFKRKFRGEELPVFFGTPALVSDLRIVAMLRLMRVL